MNVPTATITAGTMMFVTGLVMFCSVEIVQIEPVLCFIKNAGMFIGLKSRGIMSPQHLRV